MKKLFIALLIGLVMIGCASSKKTATTVVDKSTTEKIKVETGPKLQPLTQAYVSDLSPKDSALFFSKTYFFNSDAIDLSLFVVDKTIPFSVDEKGIAHKEPTNVDIVKTVPVMTDCKIIDYRLSSDAKYIIAAFLVSFDVDDKTFNLKFFRMDNGNFGLSSNAKIVYEDKAYPAEAKIPGRKDCILMFYGDEKLKPDKVNTVAKGGHSSTSTVSSVKQGEQKKVEEIW